MLRALWLVQPPPQELSPPSAPRVTARHARTHAPTHPLNHPGDGCDPQGAQAGRHVPDLRHQQQGRPCRQHRRPPAGSAHVRLQRVCVHGERPERRRRPGPGNTGFPKGGGGGGVGRGTEGGTGASCVVGVWPAAGRTEEVCVRCMRAREQPSPFMARPSVAGRGAHGAGGGLLVSGAAGLGVAHELMWVARMAP
jgi:hypothetical protein